MKLNKFKVKITLLRSMLGTNPSDPDIHETHVIEKEKRLIKERSKLEKQVNKYLDAKAITDERKQAELERLQARIEEITEIVGDDEERNDKGVTVFFRDENGMPCIGDHMIYGFLKAAADALGKTKPQKKGVVMHSVGYTQSLINQHISIEEEFISCSKDIQRDEKGQAKYFVRSLRAMTAQGPRVSIAKSECIPSGGEFEFTITVLDNSQVDEDVLRELFDYGEIVGLGQWRNAKHGTFKYELQAL